MTDTAIDINITTRKKMSRTRVIFFTLEISLVALLLTLWFSSDTIQQSKSLWVLFLYNFPSQFLIAIVPHEPVYLFFSKFYSPTAVTFVALSGTLLTEAINYSTFKFIVDLKSFDKVKFSGFIRKMIEIFNKAPFLALWVAGFTPIPFYPFRFLVVLAHYPLHRYLLALFLSRAPRFFLLALLGHAFKIPDYWLVIFFGVLIMISAVPVAKRLIFKNKRPGQSIDEIVGEMGS